MKFSDRLALATVTFGGSGLFPFAPGTVGSLAALLCAIGYHWAGGRAHWPLLVGALIAGILNVALGSWIEKYFGGKDPSSVVIDEVAGMWIALAIPLRCEKPYLIFPLAFVLFRFFDILKPLGAKKLEKLPRGWGVLLDDVLCGIYVALLLFGLGYIL